MPTTRLVPSASLASILCAMLALPGAVGCGSGKLKTYPVTGKVVYKGTGEVAKKLAGGYVIFESVSDPANNNGQGQIEEDGTFALGSVIDGANVGGVLAGEYRVRVVPPKDGESRRTIRGLLDPRFERFDKSDLRLTVKAGNNDDVTIEVEPPRR
jgi:hypothetical protein